ncbi:hypothetical protein H0H93_012927 [Arthromyces matolae]|nr:hypothetical protein H0H93_012927 [Arthromyces matolae]
MVNIEFLDLSEELVFDPTEWIGKGREVPQDSSKIPHAFHNYCAQLLAVPDEFKEIHYPSDILRVQDFLLYTLPEESHSLVHVDVKTFFQPLPANVDVESLRKRQLLPESMVQKLFRATYQAILDGMTSIEDPMYPGSRFPLWIITYFQEMHQMTAIQSAWRKGIEWLNAQALERVPNASIAQRYAKYIRWNEETKISGASTHSATNNFATFLASNTLMSSSLVDMMFSHLNDQVERDETVEGIVIVETLRFMHEISKAQTAEYYNRPSSPFLRRLEERIDSGQQEVLIFPAYLEAQKHWLTFKIDFEAREISYGDSLAHKGMPQPKAMIQKIQLWLKKRFRGPFKDLGDAMEHGQQDDYTDCGIVSANSAANEIFHDCPLWTPERKVAERIEWFIALCKAHVTDVNLDVRRIPYIVDFEPAPYSSFPPLSDFNPSVTNNVDQMDLDRPGNPDWMAQITPENPDSIVQEPRHSNPGVSDISVVDMELNSRATTHTIGEMLMSDQSKGRKRPLEETKPNNIQVDSQSAVTSVQVGNRIVRQRTTIPSRPLGQSKNAIWERARNEKYWSSQLVSDPQALARFSEKILELDKYAVIYDSRSVRHMKCGKICRMGSPYTIGNFRSHVNNCSGPPKSKKLSGGGMLPINHLFQVQSKGTVSKLPSLPCPGLEESKYEGVQRYLDRTGALGGGAHSVTVIAKELYGKKYESLSSARKKQVKVAQKHDWQWTNDHRNGRVYSIKCTKSAASLSALSLNREDQDSSDPQPCQNCRSLLSGKKFQNALRITRPPDHLYKYVNLEYRNHALAGIFGRCVGLRELIESDDSQKSPMIKYVKGVMSGKYPSNDFFGSLVQVLVLKREKEDRGVGMQGFKYPDSLVEWAHILFTHSRQAYLAVQEFLPLPQARTLEYTHHFLFYNVSFSSTFTRIQRAKQPRFPLGIEPRTFELVAAALKQLDYNGPVALGCDDTKLLAAFRPYFDTTKGAWFILGNVGKPYQLIDYEEFHSVVQSNKLEKGTKLRLFTLQVPVHKVPTIIVAALSIPETLTADDLLGYTLAIVNGFLERGIKVSSYASDGSNTERKSQRLLEQKASKQVTKHITHGGGSGSIAITLRFYGTQPIAIIQDPKHLLKTFRNNLFSGARLLTFPNDVALFSQVRAMSLADDSPIYTRDVDKADRQDDSAATRLFSGDSLLWLIEHHPDHLALITYLFVMGELIDAYQSRSLPLVTRVQMVLRAHYFIELWERFLDISEYPKAKHFVSPQCADITRTLIHGFMQVIYIYRDHCHPSQPMLPWLLSTEMVEHVFGICRQIVKDFTMLDFQYMIPKLFVRMRGLLLSSRNSNGKARASGYNHTYADIRGLDLAALSIYPSDEDIDIASKRAYGEAESLFASLGVAATELETSTSKLPGIKSWYSDSNYDNTSDSESDFDSEHAGDEEPNYQEVLDMLEDSDLSRDGEAIIQRYRMASVALSVEDRRNISILPELSEDSLVEAFSDDAAHILNTCSFDVSSLPPLVIDEPENPFNSADPSSIDLSELAQLRFKHQTKQAETGVRTSKIRQTTTLQPHVETKELTDRQKLLRTTIDAIKESGEKGVGTGVERLLRWTSRQPAPGGRDGEIDGAVAPRLATGNAENAAVNAQANATRLLKRRMDIMKKHNLPDVLGNAQITPLRPLRVAEWSSGAGYGLMLSAKQQLVLCKVLAIYSKPAGTSGRHGSVTDSSNICAVSNIAVQVFEHRLGSQFRSPVQPFLVKRFDFISSATFLSVLSEAPTAVEGGWKISAGDWAFYKLLADKKGKIIEAVKALQKSTRGKNAEVDSID